MTTTGVKRMFPAAEVEVVKKRRGPKTNDEKLKEEQKTADYWLVRPHLEFLKYRRQLVVDKMDYHRKEYNKFKKALGEVNDDIGKHDEDETEDEEDEDEEEEVEEVVEVEEGPKWEKAVAE